MTKNDFSINLGEELEKVQAEETPIDEKSISTFQVDILENSSQPAISTEQSTSVNANSLSYQVESTPAQEEVKVTFKEAKAQEEKRIMEDNRINIISEITSKWISIDEMPDQVDLEIFKKTRENKNKKKKFLYFTMWLLGVSVLWWVTYFVMMNKYLFASILGSPDMFTPKPMWNNQPNQQMPVATNCIVEQILPQSEMKIDMNTFYPIYKSDFEFIKSSSIPQQKKDDLLKKLNLMVLSYNNWTISYKDFRLQYNFLINDALNNH